jgi:uncharacterized protein YjbJ (UPF0337 family)
VIVIQSSQRLGTDSETRSILTSFLKVKVSYLRFDWVRLYGVWRQTTVNRTIDKVVGENMKPSTQGRTEGKLHEVKGKIKEEVGKVRNDPDLEVSGNVEKTTGTVQKWIGRTEKAIGG